MAAAAAAAATAAPPALCPTKLLINPDSSF